MDARIDWIFKAHGHTPVVSRNRDALVIATCEARRDSLASELRQELVVASDRELTKSLQCMLHGPGKHGPQLSDMLSVAAKLIPLRGGRGPYFAKDWAGSKAGLVPASIGETLLYGSCPQGLVDCLEAIARMHGVRALLQEEGCVRALFEIGSGSSRAIEAPSYHNPWREARALLAQVAADQDYVLGRFLSSWPAWESERYRASAIFQADPDSVWINFNDAILDLAFEKATSLFYLRGELLDIEWLLLADIAKTKVAKTEDFLLARLTQRCCLVHIPPGSRAGTVQGMQDVRTSKAFSRQKELVRALFFSTLEQRMLMPAVRLVGQFLAVEPPAPAAMAGSKSKAGGGPRAPHAPTPSPAIEPDAAVIQSVFHLDPPAEIDPQEAEAFVQVQEAGFVERTLGSAVLVQPEDLDRIWHGTFNRYPASLCQALSHGSCLRRCREALSAHGFAWKLEESGATLLVQPWQYPTVLRHLPRRATQRDVFVSGSLEFLLEQELASIASVHGSFQGAWIKAREELSMEVGSTPSRVGDANGHPLHRELVSRGILCIAPLRRPANAVTQSATAESDPEEGRIRGAWCFLSS
eukprot:CAMPEP_0179217818 /NCGR_PEP_ID=MMETSP0797-20121207/4122_1 /TAXON_ID=47934 /ORGANISM="Dinophysis acuminata, Strain DAEP01" /LENGTH=582 /DNA_ID=CAMNT_0020924083 /DNA_START=20 /DNA_END=1766 /DNA_ORIENTATION=+